MTWARFEADAPEFAEEVRDLLRAPGVVLVVSLRRDGSARLSPVEPFFWQQDLWLPMLWESLKVVDLRRDPRVLVHSVVADREGAAGEAKVRGRALFEPDRDIVAAVCDAIGRELPFQPEPDLVAMCRVVISSVALIRYADGDQHVALWHQRRRFMRRETSATSLGPPEAESGL